MEPTILVVGPGAIGLAVAAGLRQAGRDVAILGRNRAAEERLRAGFHVTDRDGRRTSVRPGPCPARTITATAAIVFICVKSADAVRAVRAAKRWINPQTVVVALQNGIDHAAAIRRVVGPARAVIGACYFAADRMTPTELRFNGGADIALARQPENREALATATGVLELAGFKVRAQDDELRMLWAKAAFNAAINPLGAACAVENGQIIEEPALRDLALKALAEAVDAAAAAGHPLDYPDLADKLLRGGRIAPRQRNSMLQDLSAGRRTEIRAIIGPFIKVARKRRVATPTLELLNALVSRLERKLAR